MGKKTMDHTQLLVLALLAGEDMYGYQMIVELARRSDHTFLPSAPWPGAGRPGGCLPAGSSHRPDAQVLSSHPEGRSGAPDGGGGLAGVFGGSECSAPV